MKTVYIIIGGIAAVLLAEHVAEKNGWLGMQAENKNVGVSPYGPIDTAGAASSTSMTDSIFNTALTRQ